MGRHYDLDRWFHWSFGDGSLPPEPPRQVEDGWYATQDAIGAAKKAHDGKTYEMKCTPLTWESDEDVDDTTTEQRRPRSRVHEFIAELERAEVDEDADD